MASAYGVPALRLHRASLDVSSPHACNINGDIAPLRSPRSPLGPQIFAKRDARVESGVPPKMVNLDETLRPFCSSRIRLSRLRFS